MFNKKYKSLLTVKGNAYFHAMRQDFLNNKLQNLFLAHLITIFNNKLYCEQKYLLIDQWGKMQEMKLRNK